jgi:hypothetical protein
VQRRQLRSRQDLFPETGIARHSLTYIVRHSLTYIVRHGLTYIVRHSLTYIPNTPGRNPVNGGM